MLRFAAIVSAWTFVSRLLGLVRDRLLAAVFGASALLDAFLVAFALPNMLRNLFGEGALSAAFVPRFVQMHEQDPAQAQAFAGVVMTRLAALLGTIAAVGLLLAAGLLFWQQSSGFDDTSRKGWLSQDITLVLALVIPQLPYMIFICVSALMAGVLQAHGRFAVPAAAPVLLNIMMIAAVWWFRDVWILPYAVLLTGLLQCGLHVVALQRCGAGPILRWRVLRWQQTPAVKELRRALIPVLFASGVYQINALLDSMIALLLVPAAGAVTVLYFANRLLQFPMALVTHAIGTALYPDLARGAESGWQTTGDSLRRAGSIQAALLLPAAVGLVLCADPLVQLIYRTGAFDQMAADRTVLATQLFAIGLLPVGANKLFVRACHAHRDQRSPWRISLIAVAINLILNIILVLGPLAEAGLALASSISAVVTMIMYTSLMRRRGAACWDLSAWIRPIIGCVAMTVAVWAWLYHVLPFLSLIADDQWGYQLWRLMSAVVIGIVVYGSIAGRDAWRRYRQVSA